MRERVREIERQVRDNGVTITSATDPLGTDRPWDLRPAAALPHDEWTHIAAAVLPSAPTCSTASWPTFTGPAATGRRATLPALVHGNAGSCAPVTTCGRRPGVYCYLYAADLGALAGRPFGGGG